MNHIEHAEQVKLVKRKRKQRSAPFDVAEARERALSILAAPPAFDWIVRPEPKGFLVAEFVLPPELCKTGNNRGTIRPGWAIGKDKSALWVFMTHQWLTQSPKFLKSLFPLPGRPQIIAVRFTNKPTDPYADWAKAPVDMLTTATLPKPTKKRPVPKLPRHRLGIIADDSPKHIELHQHWEPAPRKQGVCLVRVFSGGEKRK